MTTGDRLRRAVGRLTALAVGLTVAVALVDPAPGASALATPTREYTQGTPSSPFTLTSPTSNAISIGGGADQSLSLALGVIGEITGQSRGYTGLAHLPDPRSVQALVNGDVLVADADNAMVAEFGPDGRLVWSYAITDDPSLGRPVSAQRLANGDTIITDSAARRVFEVTLDKRVVWQYDAPTRALSDPVAAQRLPNANTLICDDGGGNRVIEVAPDGRVVWQYGTTGVAGVGPNQLRSARSAQRLSDGNTLISDPLANRVIEVTPDKRIVWQFGTSDTTNGGGPFEKDVLNAACDAIRGADCTWIADTGNNRVIGVDGAGDVVSQSGPSGNTSAPSALDQPQALSQFPDGRLAIADQGNRRIIILGTAPSASVQSPPLDLSPGGRPKEFLDLHWDANVYAPGVSLFVQYSIDGGTWLPAVGLGGFDLPPLTIGRTIAYRLTLSSNDRVFTPVVNDITITYRAWTARGSGRGGGGAGGQNPSSNGGPGTDRYGPAPSGGAGGGSGGGLGGGNGSSTGDGTAGSSGSSTSPNAAQGGPVSPVTLPATAGPAVTSAGQTITGMRVGQAGKANGGEGGGRTTFAWWRLLAGGLVVVLVACALTAPGIVVGRRRRRLVTFDHLRPACVPPARIRLLKS